ncbi:MAG: purine-binding chemotaxis protein CheW [Bermanella sp.]|jgi:purine-binding chemotaxis protein CheW
MNDVLTKDQWISFYIDGAAYAQPIDRVREIVTYRTPADVPGSPDVVEGIVNIRGDVISVVNGRALMGAANATADDDSRILIIEQARSLLGFSVDSVSEIIGFNNDQIDTSHAENALIKGTVNLEDGLFIVIDLTQYSDEQDNYE